MTRALVLLGLCGCPDADSTGHSAEKDTGVDVETGETADTAHSADTVDTADTSPPDTGDTTDTAETGVIDTDAPCDRSLPWTYVAAGSYLTCGIHTDGCTECWGRGEEDEGPNWETWGYAWTGQDIAPAEPFRSVYAVAWREEHTRELHTCALTEAGEAMCWGSNSLGESDVPPGTYTSLAVQSEGTYGLTTDSEIVAWGRVGVPTDGTFTAISTGAEIGAAITTEGDLATWWVIDGSSNGSFAGPFRAVSVKEGLCALDEAGGATCWHAWEGEGSWPDFDAEAPKAGLIDVCVGAYDSACGLQEDGHPVCWGSLWGLVYYVDTSRIYTQLACGIEHACGLTPEGEIECWGTDSYGETLVPT